MKKWGMYPLTKETYLAGMTEGTTIIPKVPSGVHKKVTKNRFRKIGLRWLYTIM